MTKSIILFINNLYQFVNYDKNNRFDLYVKVFVDLLKIKR